GPPCQPLGLQHNPRGICLLPPEEGPCRALVPRWHYDRYTQSCREFTYGGCEGNANNFRTLDDCEQSCWTIKKVPKICRMEYDEGPCRASHKKYFFNLSSMTCKEFYYGGCYGNDNRFSAVESCMDYCLPKRTGPSFCYSPKDEGMCTAFVPRYFYNATSKSCDVLNYTGCGGNENNFASQKVCYSICGKAGNKKPNRIIYKRMRKLYKRPYGSNLTS
uniref:Tissue factor pathway inhibitor 2 n=1 Tax=Sphenodon punctatus TaxID=8508 RepID=A0A8D0GBC4_SPHPU